MRDAAGLRPDDAVFVMRIIKIMTTPSHLPIHIHQHWLDQVKTVAKFLLFFRSLLGSLDQRFYEKRILGDSGGDGEDALGYSHLPQQRIVAALLNKLLEPPVGLEHVFIDGDSVRVLRAECSVGRLPSDCTIMVPELVHQNISYGWYHCRWVLTRKKWIEYNVINNYVLFLFQLE